MNLKKIVQSGLLASLALTLGFAAHAGEGADGERGGKRHSQSISAEQRVERLSEHLELSVEQESALLAVFNEANERREQVRADWQQSGQRPSRAERREAMAAGREQMTQSVQEVLTAEQWEKFQERKTNRRSKSRRSERTEDDA